MRALWGWWAVALIAGCGGAQFTTSDAALAGLRARGAPLGSPEAPEAREARAAPLGLRARPGVAQGPLARRGRRRARARGAPGRPGAARAVDQAQQAEPRRAERPRVQSRVRCSAV